MLDQRRESWLEEEKLTWKYLPKISLDQIFMDKAAFNQIRCMSSGKLDDGNLQLLSTALANGVDLPAPILFEIDTDDKESRFGIINGAHTVESKKALGRGFSDAYLISDLSDPNVIDQLRRTSNRIESGVGYILEERAQQGLFLVNRDGITVKAAADKLGIKVGLISLRKRAQAVKEELLESGVPENLVAEIPTTERAELNIIKNPAIRAEVVLLAHEARIPANERRLFYREIADAKTEARAREIVAQWRSKLLDQIHGATQGRSSFSKLGIVDRWFRNMEKDIRDKKLPVNIRYLIESLENLIRIASGLLKELRRLKDTTISAETSVSKQKAARNDKKRNVATHRELRVH